MITRRAAVHFSACVVWSAGRTQLRGAKVPMTFGTSHGMAVVAGRASSSLEIVMSKKTDPEPAQPQQAAPGTAQEGDGKTAGTEGSADSMRRAEETVDRVAERVGQYTASLGRKLLQWTSRAREEAEDIWAEAQDIRHAKKHRR